MSSIHSLLIPSLDQKDTVEIYPDELPTGGDSDLIDVLRSELAPLDVWRKCAVEYHRQGFYDEFQKILDEIIDSLNDSAVKSIYSQRADYVSGITKIYNTLASSALANLLATKSSAIDGSEVHSKNISACNRKLSEYLKKSQENSPSGKLDDFGTLLRGMQMILNEDNRKKAEKYFEEIEKSNRRGDKNKGDENYKLLYGAFIGLGISNYSKLKYQLAADNFINAIKSHPSCGASVRVAIAACFYKLEYYEKASVAVEYAFSIDPTNVDALCLMALLEQVHALKDKPSREEHRSNANDYLIIVNALDSRCATSLIHRANYYFHVFLDTGDAKLLSDTSLYLSNAADAVEVGDLLQIGNARNLVSVVELHKEGSGIRATLSKPCASSSTVGQSVVVRVKLLGRVEQYARNAVDCTTIGNIRAEAYYVLGRLFQLKENVLEAKKYYDLAMKQWPDLYTASFAMAQIYLSEKNYTGSLSLFQEIAKKNPHDKDTQAFLAFLRSLLDANTITPFEKLREYAIGFQFELDLWLVQGQARQKRPSEFPTALKCYTAALECTRGDEDIVSPYIRAFIHNNIAVLQTALGRYSNALENIRECLVLLKGFSDDKMTIKENPVFNDSEFDGVFYDWSNEVYQVKSQGDGTGQFTVVSPSEVSLIVNENVKIGDVIHRVESVQGNSFTAFSPIDVFESSSAESLSLQKKVLGMNMNRSSITACFNYARVLECNGKTQAALELYNNLIHLNPSYSECYHRLSAISANLGKIQESVTWAQKAYIIQESSNEPGDIKTNTDALLILCDAWRQSKDHQDKPWRKIYEEILSNHTKKDVKDGKCERSPHLALGNYYFKLTRGADEHDEKFKFAYKHYHKILEDCNDDLNVYMANGLGMVCVERNQLQAASTLFARAKETEMTVSEDICNNLANTYLLQSRYTEAEHVYQVNFKASIKSMNPSDLGFITNLSENMAMAQYKLSKHEEGMRTLLRGMHQEPVGASPRVWFNLAILRAYLSNRIMETMKAKGQKTVRHSNEAIGLVSSAIDLLKKVLEMPASSSMLGKRMHPEHVVNKQITRFETFKSQYMIVLKEAELDELKREEDRRHQKSIYDARVKEREEEREQRLKAEEEEREEKQRVAQEKEERLKELKDKWVAAPVIVRKMGGGRKKKDFMSGADDLDPVTNTLDEDEDEEFAGGLLTAVKPTEDKEKEQTNADDSDSDDSIFGSKRKVVEDDDEDEDDTVPAKKAKIVEEDDDLFGDD